MIGFLRGDVVPRIGNNEYTAEVVFGEERNGSLLLYDIIKIQKTQIRASLKEKDAGHVVISSEEDVDRLPASNNSIFNPGENVNGKFSLKKGMTEAERAEELRKMSLVSAVYDAKLLQAVDFDMEQLVNTYKSRAKELIKPLAEKFGVFKNDRNEQVDLEFQHSKSCLKKAFISRMKGQRNLILLPRCCPVLVRWARMLSRYISMMISIRERGEKTHK